MKDLEEMNPNDYYDDDEIDLKELFNVLWEGRKVIILITAIFAIGSVVYALSLTNYYKSETLLAARDSAQNQSLSKYSGVASLVGVKLPGSGDNKVMEAIEIMLSRKFVKHLMTFEKITPSIMAPKGYDAGSKELLFDQEKYDSETKTWREKPSYLDAHERYRGMISISQKDKSGYVSIRIEHMSPVFAKEFLELIIRETNVLLRNKDIEESSEALEYLKSELSNTSLVEIRSSINALIEQQLQTQMLAQINEDYVLMEIEPPFIPEKKSKPSRFIICIIGTMLGGMLSLAIVSIRYYLLGGKEKNNLASV